MERTSVHEEDHACSVREEDYACARVPEEGQATALCTQADMTKPSRKHLGQHPQAAPCHHGHAPLLAH